MENLNSIPVVSADENIAPAAAEAPVEAADPAAPEAPVEAPAEAPAESGDYKNLDEAWDKKTASLDKLEKQIADLDAKIAAAKEKEEKTESELRALQSDIKWLETTKRYVKMTVYACERILEKADEPATDTPSDDILNGIMAEAREKFPAPQQEDTVMYADSRGQMHFTPESAVAADRDD